MTMNDKITDRAINIKKSELSDNLSIPEEYKRSIDKAVFRWFSSNRSELIKKFDTEEYKNFYNFMSSDINENLYEYNMFDLFYDVNLSESIRHFSDGITRINESGHLATTASGRKIQPLIALLLAGCMPLREKRALDKCIILNSRFISDELVDADDLRKMIKTALFCKVFEWAGDMALFKNQKKIDTNSNYLRYMKSISYYTNDSYLGFRRGDDFEYKSGGNGANISPDCSIIADKISDVILEVIKNKNTISYESLIKITEFAADVLKNIDKVIFSVKEGEGLKLEVTKNKYYLSDLERFREVMGMLNKKSESLFNENDIGSWDFNLMEPLTEELGVDGKITASNNGGKSDFNIKLNKTSNSAEQKIKELDDLINNGIENFNNIKNSCLDNGVDYANDDDFGNAVDKVKKRRATSFIGPH